MKSTGAQSSGEERAWDVHAPLGEEQRGLPQSPGPSGSQLVIPPNHKHPENKDLVYTSDFHPVLCERCAGLPQEVLKHVLPVYSGPRPLFP